MTKAKSALKESKKINNQKIRKFMKKEKKISEDKTLLDKEKILSLQAMIANAEQTILSAKQMLAKVNSNNFTDFKKSHSASIEEGRIIYGNFDGQIMQGEDGKQYPVPANYSSKSKLVEGDVLKLTITGQGSFIYKQVGPIERKYLIGIAQNNDRGILTVNTEGKNYRVLLAAATYFKIEPGDEVTLVVPRDRPSEWGAIENVLKKADEETLAKTFDYESLQRYSQQDKLRTSLKKDEPEEDEDEAEEPKRKSSKPSAIEKLAQEMEEERKKRTYGEDLLEEWTPDLEEIRQEVKQSAEAINE